jgi:glycine cleavage system pyridoxal-binding protein P
MAKETSHALVTDPNAELTDGSQHSLFGMLALVAILILLAVAGWSLYDWAPPTAVSNAPTNSQPTTR